VAVDVQSGICFAIAQGTLPMATNSRRQIGAAEKSAIHLPSWDSHSTADGGMAKRMDTLTPLMSSPHGIKI